MESHPDTDLESASTEIPSSVALNHLIRAEVRAAVKAEVKATMATALPPTYDSSSFPSASSSIQNSTRDSTSQAKVPVTDTPPLYPGQVLETNTPATPSQVPQRPLGAYRISLALLPWLIIFSLLAALSLTVDKQGLSALAFSLVILSLAALFVVLMVLACIFSKTFGVAQHAIDPRCVKRSNFVAVIMISWHSLVCCALFGYVLYWHFFLKKGSIGQVYGEVKSFDGLVGVDGALGMLVGCLKGRVGEGSVNMGDLDACFVVLGLSS